MEARTRPYKAGFADGEANRPSDAASWVLIEAEFDSYRDGYRQGYASKWGPKPFMYEARPICPHGGHVAMDGLAWSTLAEGVHDVTCTVCQKRFRVDVQIRREFSTMLATENSGRRTR